MGAVHAAQGESSRARELLEEAAQSLSEIASSPQTWIWEGAPGQLYYAAGAAHGRLGEQDVALDYLSKAVASGWRDVHWLSSDPEFIALRSQARFQALQENLRRLPLLEFKPSTSFSTR